MIARVLGLFKGKAPPTFFSKTVEAAPTARAVLKSCSRSEISLKRYYPLFVVALDVNVLTSTVDIPRVEVDRWETGVLLQQVPACKDAQGDVLKTGYMSDESNRS
jgi:hypothetical protein